MHTAISGITWERLQRESSVTYPCLSAEDPGAPTVFIDRFDTLDGRVNLVPADIIPANERPDADFPFVLITGRQLEHWHTGSMTRRTHLLDREEPSSFIELHPDDAARLGVRNRDLLLVSSRRGKVRTEARVTDMVIPGVVFMPFHFAEGAANTLTNNVLDPESSIPEFKVCAVQVEKLP